jgi:hypothetical protein
MGASFIGTSPFDNATDFYRDSGWTKTILTEAYFSNRGRCNRMNRSFFIDVLTNKNTAYYKQ